MPTEKNAPLDPASLEIPAPFVNKFQILVAGGNVRIAFAEGFQGQPSNYRSAVAMSVADARDLAIAIIDSLPVTRNALVGALQQYADTPLPLATATETLLGNALNPKGR
jgi:hypothetical protein